MSGVRSPSDFTMASKRETPIPKLNTEYVTGVKSRLTTKRRKRTVLEKNVPEKHLEKAATADDQDKLPSLRDVTEERSAIIQNIRSKITIRSKIQIKSKPQVFEENGYDYYVRILGNPENVDPSLVTHYPVALSP